MTDKYHIMYLTKTISQAVTTGVRRIKVLLFGASDVRTAQQVTPFGIDSAPVNDMIAVYSDTGITGQQVIVGYLNKSLLAQSGELRLYSTNSSNSVQFYAWFKADGTLELNGNTDNLVRFSKLEDGFNQLRSDFNEFVSAFNSHVHATAATGPPSTPTPVPTIIPVTSSTASIADSKITEIKTT